MLYPGDATELAVALAGPICVPRIPPGEPPATAAHLSWRALSVAAGSARARDAIPDIEGRLADLCAWLGVRKAADPYFLKAGFKDSITYCTVPEWVSLFLN